MPVRLIGQKAMNRVVSHIPEVHAELGVVAKGTQARAARRLAAHRRTGSAKVTTSEGDVDWFVNLDDLAAESIEFGHMVKGKYETDKPKYVPGLYILSRAAGLA